MASSSSAANPNPSPSPTSTQTFDIVPIFEKLMSDPTYINSMNTAYSTAVKAVASALFSQFINVRVDWEETPNCHIIKMDLPGVKKEQVMVEMEEETEDGHVLVISGEKKKHSEEVGDVIVKTHRAECKSGKFCYRFSIPEDVKVDEINDVIDDGVLTVTVPKVNKVIKSVEITNA